MAKSVPFSEVEGRKYSKLAVYSDLGLVSFGTKGKRARYVRCKCDCGEIIDIALGSVLSGNAKSCGCYRKSQQKKAVTTHGLSGHKIYQIWKRILQRCNNKQDPNYFNYGGRGITVCDKWLKFENFAEDMLPTYKEGLSIDRTDNNSGYFSENCKWITHKENSRNTRMCKYIKYKGVQYCYSALEEKMGLTKGVIHHRLRLGWTIEKAAETPVGKKRNSS